MNLRVRGTVAPVSLSGAGRCNQEKGTFPVCEPRVDGLRSGGQVESSNVLKNSAKSGIQGARDHHHADLGIAPGSAQRRSTGAGGRTRERARCGFTDRTPTCSRALIAS
jgi:hypothetical protein